MFALGDRKVIGIRARAVENDKAEGTKGGDASGYDDDVHFDPVGGR